MSPKLWFCIPAYGRVELARICLRQMRRTCDALIECGIAASAVVVADDENLETARKLGFATVPRDNAFVGRRFNDAIQLATDPRFNPRPADYVVPCGSDDWVDYRLFLEPLPPKDTVQGFQRMSFVREDGLEISTTFIDYQAGSGIRIIPRELVAPLGYRPADEDRRRACDTSILSSLRRHHGDRLKVSHWHLHDRQIVDWKTHGTQLNPYREVTGLYRVESHADPFEELAEFYPVEALDQMRAYYGVPKLVTA